MESEKKEETEPTVSPTKEPPKVENSPKNPIEKIAATKEYFCEDDLILKGNQCSIEFVTPLFDAIMDSTKIETDFYEEQQTIENDNLESLEIFAMECYFLNGILGNQNSSDISKISCQIKIKIPFNKKFCFNDTFTIKNNDCRKEMNIDAEIRYTCPKDYRLNGTDCFK